MRSRNRPFSPYLFCLFALFLMPAPRGGNAAEAVAPAGTVLVIEGKVKNGSPVHLDMATIRALPAVTFTTFDPWDNRDRTYTGPRIADVLALAGVSNSARYIEVSAANDYRVPILLADLDRFGHILSYRMDGKDYGELGETENKGDLAVAIDFTGKRNDISVFKNQLAWWVQRITVK